MRLIAVAGGPPAATATEWAAVGVPAGLTEAMPEAIVGTTAAVVAVSGACSFRSR